MSQEALDHRSTLVYEALRQKVHQLASDPTITLDEIFYKTKNDATIEWDEIQKQEKEHPRIWKTICANWKYHVIRLLSPKNRFKNGGHLRKVPVKGANQNAIIQHIQQIASEASKDEARDTIVTRCLQSITTKWRVISKDGTTEVIQHIVRTVVSRTLGQDDSESSDTDVVALCEKFDGDEIVEVVSGSQEIDISVSGIEKLHHIQQENPRLYEEFMEMQKQHLKTKALEAQNETNRIEIEKFKAEEETKQVIIKNGEDTKQASIRKDEETKKAEEETTRVNIWTDGEIKQAEETTKQVKIKEEEETKRLQLIEGNRRLELEIEQEKLRVNQQPKRKYTNVTQKSCYINNKRSSTTTIDAAWIEEHTPDTFANKKQLSKHVWEVVKSRGCTLEIKEVYKRIADKFWQDEEFTGGMYIKINPIPRCKETIKVVYIPTAVSTDEWVKKLLPLFGYNDASPNYQRMVDAASHDSPVNHYESDSSDDIVELHEQQHPQTNVFAITGADDTSTVASIDEFEVESTPDSEDPISIPVSVIAAIPTHKKDGWRDMVDAVVDKRVFTTTEEQHRVIERIKSSVVDPLKTSMPMLFWNFHVGDFMLPTFLDLQHDPFIAQVNRWATNDDPREAAPVYPAVGVVDPRPGTHCVTIGACLRPVLPMPVVFSKFNEPVDIADVFARCKLGDVFHKYLSYYNLAMREKDGANVSAARVPCQEIIRQFNRMMPTQSLSLNEITTFLGWSQGLHQDTPVVKGIVKRLLKFRDENPIDNNSQWFSKNKNKPIQWFWKHCLDEIRIACMYVQRVRRGVVDDIERKDVMARLSMDVNITMNAE